MKYTLTLERLTVNQATNAINVITEHHKGTSVCSLFHLAGIKLNGKSKWEKAIIKNANGYMVFEIEKTRLLTWDASTGRTKKTFNY